MQMTVRFPCQGWKQKGRQGGIETSRAAERRGRQRGSEGGKWWMWGSQQRYIPYLCLALSPLSAAKCQCQSKLCSAGTSPSTAGLWQHRSHQRVSKHLPGSTHNTVQTLKQARAIAAKPTVSCREACCCWWRLKTGGQPFIERVNDGKYVLTRFHKITHFLTSREPRRLELTTATCEVNTYKIIFPLGETQPHTHTTQCQPYSYTMCLGPTA